MVSFGSLYSVLLAVNSKDDAEIQCVMMVLMVMVILFGDTAVAPGPRPFPGIKATLLLFPILRFVQSKVLFSHIGLLLDPHRDISVQTELGGDGTVSHQFPVVKIHGKFCGKKYPTWPVMSIYNSGYVVVAAHHFFSNCGSGISRRAHMCRTANYAIWTMAQQ